MRIMIDTATRRMEVTDEAGAVSLDLYGEEAFRALSLLWLKTGWNLKYSYTFTWLGRPVIQHPEDMIRLQEVIHSLAPDVIIETGIAHGGSLIFSASLLKLLGKGRVIGVDIEIRPHNRRAIEAHPLASLITLVEGDSASQAVVERAAAHIQRGDRVMVILDSNHSKKHVLAELEAYAPLVTPGSYIVATDGIMRDLADVPRGDPNWRTDNPAAAAEVFARRHPEFAMEDPRWMFNESPLAAGVTCWPNAWLKRQG